MWPGRVRQALFGLKRQSEQSLKVEEAAWHRGAQVLQRLLQDSRPRDLASQSRAFSSSDEEPSRQPKEDVERQNSGSKASTSGVEGPKVVRNPFKTAEALATKGAGRSDPDRSKRGDTAAGSSLGGAVSTLDAKKAYRENKLAQHREQQQRTAAEQARMSPTLAAKQAARAEQREEELAREEAALADMPNPWDEVLAYKRLETDLGPEDFSKYVTLNKALLPEVFWEGKPPLWEQSHPKGGCPGLQDEFAAAKSEEIMFRECIDSLILEVASRESKKLFLIGPTGSGKSIALAAVVARMRQANWLVMYVPQPKQLTHGGFFSRHEPSSQWDTAECAKLMMHYLVAGNPGRVDDVTTASGQTIRQVVEAALQNKEASEVVDAFLEVRQAVAEAPCSLIAVDNYQALYCPSEYGEWTTQHHRRVIQPGELRVAAAMRVLEQDPPPDGVFLCASTRSGEYSNKLRMPMPHEAPKVIPRFSLSEWTSMADYYSLCDATDEVSDSVILRGFFLTEGNPKEYRKYSTGIAFDPVEVLPRGNVAGAQSA